VRATLERGGSQLRRIDEGWVVRTGALPAVWALNHISIAEDIDFARAVRLAEEHLADLPYRHLVVEEAPTLEPEARAAGWKVEREVVMALANACAPPTAAGLVIEPDEEQVLALMRRPRRRVRGRP
jgi:hypothetical protein